MLHSACCAKADGFHNAARFWEIVSSPERTTALIEQVEARRQGLPVAASSEQMFIGLR